MLTTLVSPSSINHKAISKIHVIALSSFHLKTISTGSNVISACYADSFPV